MIWEGSRGRRGEGVCEFEVDADGAVGEVGFEGFEGVADEVVDLLVGEVGTGGADGVEEFLEEVVEARDFGAGGIEVFEEVGGVAGGEFFDFSF